MKGVSMQGCKQVKVEVKTSRRFFLWIQLEERWEGAEGWSCIQKKASVMEVKSCQKWVMDKTGGIDPQAKSTVCLSCTAQQQLLFSCCARLAAPRSLCVCVCTQMCVCVCFRERKRERAARVVDFSLSSTPTLICMLLQPPLSLSLSLFWAHCFPPSFPHSLSLARLLTLSLPRSLSPVYLQSQSSLSVDHHPALSLLLYIYLARTADNSPCNIFSSFVCELSCRPLIPAPCWLYPCGHKYTHTSVCVCVRVVLCICCWWEELVWHKLDFSLW